MKLKRILFAIVALALLSPIFAAETFYQTIFNASYLGDFAYNAFPLSLWADFGISGLEVAPDLTTKIYARVMAGLTERRLNQYPETGDIIDIDQFPESLSYAVAFSDGSLVFEQGVMKDPDYPSRDMLSISLSLRMRWEQAFATFNDIRVGDYGGIFDNTQLFPTTSSGSFLAGTPELSGNKYFLSNSFSFDVSFNRLITDYMTRNGYKIDAGMVFAPLWLGNNLRVISPKIETDSYRFRVSGEYDYTILNKKSQSGKNLYSLYATASASTTFIFGKSIPRYLQDKSFMGKSIVPRLFYGDIYAKLQFNGPELLSLGTYPALYLFLQNGLNSGSLINSSKESPDTEFFGGFGFGVQLTLIGYLRAFLEYSYIYTPIFGEDAGGSLGYGCYFTMLF